MSELRQPGGISMEQSTHSALGEGHLGQRWRIGTTWDPTIICFRKKNSTCLNPLTLDNKGKVAIVIVTLYLLLIFTIDAAGSPNGFG